jgi:arabinan endo-1,5-alpha-L-arabinosidase
MRKQYLNNKRMKEFLNAQFLKKIMPVILSLILFFVTGFVSEAFSQQQPTPTTNINLQELHRRDVCIYPDPVTKTYILIGSAGRTVVSFTSKDLLHWNGPRTLFSTPQNFWGDVNIRSIWAPELHAYNGKYYLFLTFDTDKLFPEQWLNWRPRVTRGSQILVSDSLFGQYKPFQDHSTLPVSMMTLDGTLWVEGGIPYIVFAHEWVQISNGTIECAPLKDDLSEITAQPSLLFRANEAPWAMASKAEGCYVTDGPFLYKSKSGKLMMIWASFSEGGYTEGIAISESGKLAGPWKQQAEPLYTKDGGHAMLFKTFEGKLMMTLHSPNTRDARPHIFEMEDTGNTLKIAKELKL